MNGFLVIDKPAGISSFSAVRRVKRMLPRGTKIGHAGTLDPFANGVLILLIGKATKSCESLMDQPKSYETTIQFGATTETDDLDSPATPWPGEIHQPSEDKIRDAIQKFVGEIDQRPPKFSALKIGGVAAYKRARRGEEIKIASRIVRVYEIQLLDFVWPSVKLKIDCGRGTYIRSIARDLGETLNVGGYLTQLRRTKVGEFSVDRAAKLDELSSENLAAHVIPLADQNSENPRG